jgi:hypothetical protein
VNSSPIAILRFYDGEMTLGDILKAAHVCMREVGPAYAPDMLWIPQGIWAGIYPFSDRIDTCPIEKTSIYYAGGSLRVVLTYGLGQEEAILSKGTSLFLGRIVRYTEEGRTNEI